MRERRGLKKGGNSGALVEAEGRKGPAEGRGVSDSGSGKGLVATGIRQA